MYPSVETVTYTSVEIFIAALFQLQWIIWIFYKLKAKFWGKPPAPSFIFTSNNHNSSPQQPPCGESQATQHPHCADEARAPAQGEATRSRSTTLAWISEQWPAEMKQELSVYSRKPLRKTAQSKGTSHLILSTGLADLMICLGFYHCQKSDK